MNTISLINEDAGRKATLSDQGLALSKITGTVRKSEKLIFPLFKGERDALLAKAESWLMEGRP